MRTERIGGGGRLGITRAPRLTMEQRMMRALWSLYLRLEHDEDDGPQALDHALEVVAAWKEVPSAEPAVRLALWNLVPTYATKKPPDCFVTMLDELFGVDLARARTLYTDSARSPFPPFTPRIRDALFLPEPEATSLRLTVAAKYDDLRDKLVPSQWARFCPLIWSGIRADGDHWVGQLNAPTGLDSADVDLRVHVDAGDPESFGIAATVTLGASPPFFTGGEIKFSMEPEPEHPDWTRIEQKRAIQFTDEIGAELRGATLAYWTLSETACLLSN